MYSVAQIAGLPRRRVSIERRDPSLSVAQNRGMTVPHLMENCGWWIGHSHSQSSTTVKLTL